MNNASPEETNKCGRRPLYPVNIMFVKSFSIVLRHGVQ